MDSTGNRWFLLRTILVVAGSGWVFGYDIGIVSSTLLSIKNDIRMTSLSEGWFVGMIGAGGFLGCVVAGPLCDAFGRWNTMFLQNIIFAVGALITASSHNITQLLIGRFLVGIASVTSAIAGVPYMTEISPAALRGKMICMYEIWVSVGVLASFLAGYILVDMSHAGAGADWGWRYAYAVPAVVSLLQTLCLFTLPESPKWLLERGRLPEAYTALEMKFGKDSFNQQWDLLRTQRVYLPSGSGTSIRIELEIENLFKLMHPDLNGGLSPRASHSQGLSTRNSHSNSSSSGGTEFGNISPSRSSNNTSGLRDGDRTSNSVKAVAALAQFRQDMNQEGALIYEYGFPILFLLAFQAFTQLSGGVVIRNYAATIFADNGKSEVQALRAVTILGGFKLLTTLWSVYYIERIGRRLLLMIGCGVVGVGCLTLAFASTYSIGGGTGFLMIGCILAVSGYGIGYGPIPWALSSEMFPVAIRGKVIAMGLVSQNVFLLITNVAYLQMLENVGASGTFYIFFLFNMTCFLLVYYMLPETRTRSPEIILQLFSRYRQVPIWEGGCGGRRLAVEGITSYDRYPNDHELVGNHSNHSDSNGWLPPEEQGRSRWGGGTAASAGRSRGTGTGASASATDNCVGSTGAGTGTSAAGSGSGSSSNAVVNPMSSVAEVSLDAEGVAGGEVAEEEREGEGRNAARAWRPSLGEAT